MALAGVAPESQLFAPRIDALPLCEGEIVGRGEVLVECHVVVQVLIGCDRRQDEPLGGVLCVQAAVQQAAAVERRAVVGDAAHVFRQFFFRALHRAEVAVGVFVVLAVGIVRGKVYFPPFGGQVDPPHASSAGFFSSGRFVAHLVLVESLGTLVEGVQGIGHLLACFPVVRGRGLIAVVFHRSAQPDVCSLVAERVSGEHAQDASHGIPPVEGGLGAA